ncbi:MAG: hypothetical protein ACLS36_08620 [Streptococcus sp.]
MEDNSAARMAVYCLEREIRSLKMVEINNLKHDIEALALNVML